MSSDDDEQQSWRDWYERKSAFMEASLGKEHDRMRHSVIPFAIGGGLDLYYFPNGIPGTAIATKELCESRDDGSSNVVFDDYELVMFTRQRLDMKEAENPQTAFGKAHASINAFLNCIAAYSAEATLNPNETCEFPAEMASIGGRCLIFDGYACHRDEEGKTFGLLALIEIFRSEMDFARANGGAQLLQRLKDAGHYPYSDLDRAPVA